jgi:hypothetical protein
MSSLFINHGDLFIYLTRLPAGHWKLEWSKQTDPYNSEMMTAGKAERPRTKSEHSHDLIILSSLLLVTLP